MKSCAVSGAALTDGGCACALAFSTLLSSQGADAHHHGLSPVSGATLLTYLQVVGLSTRVSIFDSAHDLLYIQHTVAEAFLEPDFFLRRILLAVPEACPPLGVPCPLGHGKH